MQVDVNPRSGRLGVVGREIQEGIKCRGWIRIQKCFPQSRRADFVDGQILAFVPRITKTQLPVPTLEIIAKFSHLSSQPNVEKGIPVGELFMSGTRVVNAAESNSGSHRETGAVREEIWISRIRECEGIKRILDWHTEEKNWTIADASGWCLEWVGYKRHS